jgi:hypothetical protein
MPASYTSRRPPRPATTGLIPPTHTALAADAPARAQLRAALATHFLAQAEAPHYHRWTANPSAPVDAKPQAKLLVGDPITLVVIPILSRSPTKFHP